MEESTAQPNSEIPKDSKTHLPEHNDASVKTSTGSEAGEINDHNHSHVLISKMRALQNGVFPVDKAIIETLPEGFTIVSAEPFGHSKWAITGKLIAESPAIPPAKVPTKREFFMKIAYGETGRIMLYGESESSKIIYELMPDFTPEPIKFAEYHENAAELKDKRTYFYMSQFVDMHIKKHQNPDQFCERLAQLHRKSQSSSTRFGFHVTTCDGDREHVVGGEREDSWAVFLQKMLLRMLDRDIERNGPWAELERAGRHVAEKVVPKLLGNLKWQGKPIKPSLIHGDLWEANAGIREETNLPMLFDAGSYYAHNEMQLGHWACEFSVVFGKPEYMDAYTEHFEKAEPASEFEDRIRLYSLKGLLNYSAGHPGSDLRKS